jgi:hypothetical protein
LDQAGDQFVVEPGQGEFVIHGWDVLQVKSSPRGGVSEQNMASQSVSRRDLARGGVFMRVQRTGCQAPVCADWKMASITAMLAMPSSRETGTGVPSRIAREKASP